MRRLSAQQMERIRADHRANAGLGALEATGELAPANMGFASDDDVFNERINGGAGATWNGFDITQASVTQPAQLDTPNGPQPIPPVIAYPPPYFNHNKSIGNVIAGGIAAIQVLPQNNLRTALFIQNSSATVDLLFNFGGQAASGNFLRIPANANLANAWAFDNGVCPRDQLFVAFSAAGGTGFYIEVSWGL